MKRVVEDFILYPFGALGPRKDLRQNIQVVHAFIDKHIDRVLQARQSPAGLPEHAAEEQQSVLEQLAESTQDKCEIRSDMLNLLFAGRDSTASSLTNCFYFLARRPDIWQALRLEVSQANIACADTASLRTLPYLQACLQECKSSLFLHKCQYRTNYFVQLSDYILRSSSTAGPQSATHFCHLAAALTEAHLYL